MEETPVPAETLAVEIPAEAETPVPAEMSAVETSVAEIPAPAERQPQAEQNRQHRSFIQEGISRREEFPPADRRSYHERKNN